MFAQRLSGHSVARITPCAERRCGPVPVSRRPAAEPASRRHGMDAGLGGGDPGQPAVHRPAGVEPAAHRLRPDRPGQHRAGGHRPVQRWNLPAGWVISAHPAIVGEAGCIAVQDVSAARGPRRPGHAPLPAGGAAALRPVRAAAGVGLVQRQARLPVPPRVHQRRRARARPAEERAHPRGPDPAPADGPGHPPGSRKPCPGRREPGQRQEHCSRSGRRPDRSPAGRRRQHHLRPSHAGADPGHDGSARRSWPTDARGARHGPGRRPGPPGCPRRSARG